MCILECHVKVSHLPTHPGRLLHLHVTDGGEGGPPGGVQGQAGHNLPDILLLLDACPGLQQSAPCPSEIFRLVEHQCERFPIQALNFTFVPQQFRVIYIATCRCAETFFGPPNFLY